MPAVGLSPAGPEAGSLPCLLLTIQPEQLKNRSAIAKKAECLHANLDGLIKRVGIERVGFVTLTFPDNVTDRIEAERRFNSLSTHVLRQQHLEFVVVPERQSSGRLHFHLAAAFPWDIRSGFNFDALQNAATVKREHYRNKRWDSGKFCEFKLQERIYFESANERLREWWHYFRQVSRRYGFGRCETLPVISNAAAIARYVGAYVTTASDARTIADKGSRTVRYSFARVPVECDGITRKISQRTASVKFSWLGGTGGKWRRGLQLLGTVFELDLDGLAGLFGTKFQYEMRRVIFILGDHFDAALPLCSRVPEWADHASRVGFLARLLNSLQTETVFDLNLLNSQPDCPY